MSDENDLGKSNKEVESKKELKFSDVAFKPSEDGKLVYEVMNVKEEDADYEDDEHYEFSQPLNDDKYYTSETS